MDYYWEIKNYLKRSKEMVCLLIKFLLVNGLSFAQDSTIVKTQELKSLSEYIYEISSINPEDTSFNDLWFLKYLLQDKRIITLGEVRHTDGASILARNRLIRFLHQEMGFQVLIQEAPFYSNHKVWDMLLKGVDTPKILSMQRGNFLSEFDKNLYTYIESWKDNEFPLELAGMDIGDEVNNLGKTFIKDLENYLTEVNDPIIKTREWRIFYKNFPNLIQKERKLKKYERAASFIANSIINNDRIQEKEHLFFYQSILNSIEFKRWGIFSLKKSFSEINGDEWNCYYNLRDKQMAENIIFLLDSVYRDKKVIITSSSYHLMNNVTTELGLKYPQLGQILKDKYYEEIYSIAFITEKGYSGEVVVDSLNRFGFLTDTFSITCIPQSVESRLSDFNKEYLFVNLNHPIIENSWLNAKNYLTAWYEPKLGNWKNIFDGLFYIDEMFPKRLYIYPSSSDDEK